MAYIGHFIDRSPAITPAGVVFPRNDCVVGLMKYYPEEDQIAALKREANIKDCKFKNKLPPYTDSRNLGIQTAIRPVLRPIIPSKFKQYEIATRESIYDSNKNYFLGRGRFPHSKPDDISILTGFGKPSHVDMPLYEIILPKDYEPELLKEKKELYNSCFNPRETMGRYYDCDKRGVGVKKVFDYMGYPSNVCTISRLQGAHRERTKSNIGKGLEPCKVRLNVPIDHAYGKTSKIYKYGVREIMKTCEPCEFKIELLKSISYLNKIRYLLKQRETYFPDVIVYVKEMDKNNCQNLHKHELLRLFANIGIILDYDKMELVLKYFKIADENDCIHYISMIKLLDKSNEFPTLGKIKDVPDKDLWFETTYYALTEDMHQDISRIRPAGLPGKRYDLVYPKTPEQKCMRGMLSDETNMVSLIEPNIGTLYGLSHRDYFLLRSKDEVFMLFQKAGYNMENAELVWEKCLNCDPCNGSMVSIDTFRTIYNLMRSD